MSLLHTVRNVQRVRHIATVLIKHGFGQVIEKLDLEYRIFVKKFAKTSSDIQPQSLQNAHAWCLRNSARHFAKLGQVLSTLAPICCRRVSFMSSKKLQDHVSPIVLDEISDQITISENPRSNFSSFRPSSDCFSLYRTGTSAILRSTMKRLL